MNATPPLNDPYESAGDLPSFVEMREQLDGMKALVSLLAPGKQAQLLKLEAGIERMCGIVDAFYDLLGPRNWIFHDLLSLDRLSDLLDLPVDDAERGLISVYEDQERLGSWIRTLDRFDSMRGRMPSIEQARADFEEGRYYSTVQLLLSVMDGFVNDLDSQRRGLHTRHEDEMTAWDSVVGHHMGLKNAHRTFTKTIGKTSDKEVHELYRNGIVHGTLLNYDNVVVAAKAWNRLFAVADWATSLEKQAIPPEPEPSLGEVLLQVNENRKAKKALAEWEPRIFEKEDPGFANEAVFGNANKYLESWANKNFGAMAELLASIVSANTHAKTAG